MPHVGIGNLYTSVSSMNTRRESKDLAQEEKRIIQQITFSQNETPEFEIRKANITEMPKNKRIIER